MYSSKQDRLFPVYLQVVLCVNINSMFQSFQYMTLIYLFSKTKMYSTKQINENVKNIKKLKKPLVLNIKNFSFEVEKFEDKLQSQDTKSIQTQTICLKY